MKKCFLCLLLAGILAPVAGSRLYAGEPPRQEYYQLIVYHLENAAQEQRTDRFLENALLPALHRAGVAQVGVFKPIENTTGKKIYVFIPQRTIGEIETLDTKLAKDRAFLEAGKDFLNTPHDDPAYGRIEKILLKAFAGMPHMALPDLAAPKSQRVYELRSYESASEKLHRNKVKMFNDGDEVGIFRRLGFNAVFYGEVLAGGKMPNLMYMTAFSDMASRDKHWDAFRKDPAWKELSSMEEYQHNVSHSDILLLRPADYSDI